MMTWSITFYWGPLGDVALTAATLILMFNLVFLRWLMYYEPKQTQLYYIPKQACMQKSQWIKAYLKLFMEPTGQWLIGLTMMKEHNDEQNGQVIH